MRCAYLEASAGTQSAFVTAWVNIHLARVASLLTTSAEIIDLTSLLESLPEEAWSPMLSTHLPNIRLCHIHTDCLEWR